MEAGKTNTANLLRTVAREGEKLRQSERRNFLKQGLLVAGGTLTATALAGKALADDNLPPNVPGWTKSLGPGVVTNPYGKPSQFEDHIVRRNVPWLTADRIASISFTPLAELSGIITPSSLVFERYHSGVPQIDPNQHWLMIHGMVDRPIILSVDDLRRFPSTSMIRFLECPANGGYGVARCTNGCIAVYSRNAELLRMDRRAAIDIVARGWTKTERGLGAGRRCRWCSHESIHPAGQGNGRCVDCLRTKWRTASAGTGLSDTANKPRVGKATPALSGCDASKSVIKRGITERKLLSTPICWQMGRARKFSYVQECNSVVTFPCPEKPLTEKGRYEVQGLAWSGKGRVSQVDVSFDGGVNWRPAKLKGLVLPKSLTRFGLEWDWDGAPALIQSRAIDETGYVQPTYTQLREARGSSSIYHKNAIHTWRLHDTGKTDQCPD